MEYKHGWTPLHQAVQTTGMDEVAQLLIARGACVNLKDREEKTPLDLSYDLGMKELLEKHGAVSGKELREEEK